MMETWILMVWISTLSRQENEWRDGTPTPIIFDYPTKTDCQNAATDFIGSRAAEDFAKYGYAVEFVSGGMHKNYRCIRGPRR